MWKSVAANQALYQGYDYIERRRVKGSGGKSTYVETRYTNIPLLAVHKPATIKQHEDGYSIIEYTTIIVPARYFDGISIRPDQNDFVEADNTSHRVVAVRRVTDARHFGVYELLLRKEEIAV